MKSFRFLIFTFIAALCTMPCSAQYEKYYQVNNSTYVTTTPNAELYELSSSDVDQYVNNSYSTKSREIIDTSNCKKKKIKKSQQLRVVRYTNTSTQQDFNAYIVEYKDKFWILLNSYVKDNTLLKERSAKMLKDKEDLEFLRKALNSQLDSLNQKRDDLEKEYNKLISKYKKECTDSLRRYQYIKAQIPQIVDSLVAIKKAEEEAKANKAYNSWFKKQPASTQRAMKAITITEYGLCEPNYVGGCDFYLSYINNSSKTIKYLYWTGVAYNRVNDLAYCEIRRSAVCKGWEQGPIEPLEEGGGEWSCVIYNNWAETMKLTNIRIEYMDGTSLNIAEADINRMLNEPEIEVAEVDASAIKNRLFAETQCSEKVALWNERLTRLNQNTFYEGPRAKAMNDNSYKDVWTQLQDLVSRKNNLQPEINNIKNEVKKFDKQIESFEQFIEFKSSHSTTNSSYQYTSSNSSYSSSSSYNKPKSEKKTKNPFVTVGLEGSIEGLKSFSTGWGASMRIGRFNSLFNVTIGAKYQYTGCKEHVWYVYSDSNYRVYSGDADYKQQAHQLVIPINLNLNVYRDDTFAYYLGIGYEHGLLSATTRNYENMSSDFNTYHLFESDDYYDIVNISTPSRTVIFQTGIAGRHYEFKVYYKLYANAKRFPNGDKGALGTAFTYYF